MLYQRSCRLFSDICAISKSTNNFQINHLKEEKQLKVIYQVTPMVRKSIENCKVKSHSIVPPLPVNEYPPTMTCIYNLFSDVEGVFFVTCI